MPPRTYSILDPGEYLPFTGERYTTGVSGDIQNEHYHRYLFALRFCEGLDVLDVASGEGYGTALLASVARSVVGVDIDEESVAFSSRAYARDNLRFQTGSALALPLDDGCVDAVISFETLEHLKDSTAFLSEIKRVLRPGGILVVSTPDKKVYSDDPGYRNPFHIKEFYRDEFWTLLTADFPFVGLYEQQVLAGSVLSRVSRVGDGNTESFATMDGHNFEYALGLPKAPYLVAVASSELISLPSVSFLHGLLAHPGAAFGTVVPVDNTASTAKSIMTDKAVALNAEVVRLRGQLLDANLEADKIKRQLLEIDRERGFLRAMLMSARRLADQARAELVQVRESAEAQVTAAEALAAAADQARAELVQVRESAEARATAAEVRAAAAEAGFVTQIDTIRRSTSWRLTRPIRGVKILARRILR